MLGNFACFLSSAVFFENQLFEKFFQKYDQSVKQFGPRSGLTFVRPDLGPNCLQRFSADDISLQKQQKITVL